MGDVPVIDFGGRVVDIYDWIQCKHDWKEVDSQFSNELFTDVHCKICGCVGEMDNRTGEVFYPAT